MQERITDFLSEKIWRRRSRSRLERPSRRQLRELVKGRNVITGLPKVVTLTSEEIRMALKDATGQIVEMVHGVLEKTPPELAADIVDRGIVLTGGGALLHGMDSLIEQRTGVSTLTVQNAMSVVAIGTGKYAEVMARFDG